MNLAEILGHIPFTAGLREKLRERKHENAMMNFYPQFIEPGDICFDVGANVGKRTAVFVRLGAKVVAVEPQPACVKVLKERFRNERHVAIIEAGLGDREGTHQMLVGSERTAASHECIEHAQKSGQVGSHEWNHTIQVPMTTLDALIERFGRPAFVKIDVEGFELPVLLGLSQPVPGLAFEFTPETMENTATALRHLASLGSMTTNYALGTSMALQSASWMPWEELAPKLMSLEGNTAWGEVYVRFKG